MPGFDRTGPGGMGSTTGGGRGFCASPGGVGRSPAGGRTFFGRGAGRGWRNRLCATWLGRRQRRASWAVPPVAEDEKQALKSEADSLRERLRILEERLAALNTDIK